MPDALPSSEAAFGPPAQADVSADAALILAALGRMEAVVRNERATFGRLRTMLGEMAEAISKAKAVADSETAANALDELEHRVDAMLEVASGAGSIAESQAFQTPPVSAPPVEPVAEAPAASAAQVPSAGDAAAPDAHLLDEHAAKPPAADLAEHDQVPTVSGVVSQLTPSDEAAPQAAADVAPQSEYVSGPTVAMLTAMVEALRDSISTAPPESATAPDASLPEVHVEAAAPPLDVAPRPETSSLESAESATPAPDTAQPTEALHRVETPEAIEPVQVAEAAPAVEVAEAADNPPTDAAPSENPVIAILNARLEALRAAAAAPEPEAAVEDTQPALPVAEVAVQPADVAADLAAELAAPLETSSIAIAEAIAPAAETAQAEAASDENWAVAAWPEPEQIGAHGAPSPADIAIPPSDRAPHTDAAANEVVDVLAQAVELALAAKPITEPATPTAEIARADSAGESEAPQAIETPQAAETTTAIEETQSAGVPSPTDAAPDNAPFVAMLRTRLEALRAAEAARAAEAPPIEAVDPAEAAVAAPAPGPSVTVHESALLASLQQMMGTRPIPPPDEGTAVIFTPKPEIDFLPAFAREAAASSEALKPEQATAPQAEMESAAITPVVYEPAAIASTLEVQPNVEAGTPPAELATKMTLREAIQAAVPKPAPAVEATEHAEPAVPIEPTAEAAAMAEAPHTAAAPETAEADFDPAAFLFGPEPEPDPAAFLLDPAPPAPEFTVPAKPTTEKPEALQPAEPGQPAQPKPEAAPRDPLHALKAMSENEKIALFS